ncbi:transcription termination factor Rho [Lentzea nigeriaca]|uniref:transcription termination factor Rho n=1 Tax=Lentzea nigeriaca TaxID=1128665 RepID=UPI0027DD6B6B|nr:transcription termination factor Rho [Lentzea nigeriaca]MBM7857345.1 transcription termination factor Rho [Lentzea nigeriaca]
MHIGVLDIRNNKAFLVDGPQVSQQLVKQHDLRRGDQISGEAVDGKLVGVDTVNGRKPHKRPKFGDLTPLYPNERLRLEHDPHELTSRTIDLVMPVGKGQRALIVAPPKAGKTIVLQQIAQAIAKNNPECHLIVTLVGERPEEVTDLTGSIPGEIFASTFDEHPKQHVQTAELAVERAKRLVEDGQDVVILLDSLTRLGRAYNLAAPSGGRILSGGIDSGALTPPKQFLGAARNIEEGGSLTIFATALVETGSLADTVIFEELKSTGNAELKLDRKAAQKRIYPAVDLHQSSTRKAELLVSPQELAITDSVRRAMADREIDVLLEGLRKTRSNAEFLIQMSK